MITRPQKRPSVLVYATAFSGTGGIESHLQNFCENMSTRISIDLIIPQCTLSSEQRRRLSECCVRTDFFSSRHPVVRLSWLLGKLLARRRKHYDVLYTNGQGESIEAIGWLIRHGRWIHHHHTSGDIEDSCTWPRRYFDAMRRADHVVACSDSNALSMGAILSRKVESVRYITSQLRVEQDPVHGRPLRFGFFGRLIREKGIDMIARLSEDPSLPDIEWHIWGEGKQYPESFFRDHPKIVKHPAFRDIGGLRQALASLDAYTLFSTNPEGLPLALLECLGAGVPWIATDRGGIRDVLCDPASTVLLPAALDYQSARNAVRVLAANIRSGTSRPGRLIEYYDANLSVEALCGQWMKLMNS
jgi:glycosyltransferase involved in cell wall biosynthesis